MWQEKKKKLLVEGFSCKFNKTHGQQKEIVNNLNLDSDLFSCRSTTFCIRNDVVLPCFTRRQWAFRLTDSGKSTSRQEALSIKAPCKQQGNSAWNDKLSQRATNRKPPTRTLICSSQSNRFAQHKRQDYLKNSRLWLWLSGKKGETLPTSFALHGWDLVEIPAW